MTTYAVVRPGGETAEAGRPALPPRKAVIITAVVLVGFFVIDGSFVWAENPPEWERVGAVLGFALTMGLQLSHSFPRLLPQLARHRYATWAAQAVLAYAPLSVFGDAWGGMISFLSASAVLVFPAAVGWPLFGVTVLSNWALFRYLGYDANTTAYNMVEAVLIPLIVIGLSRMSEMIGQLHRSRAQLSRLAVAGERLRFARDLHDVLGFSLSSVTLKCELAYRLLADAPAKAHEELTGILTTSRKALADVRSVSRGYREMSLTGEAEAAVSMLSAAGIRTRLTCDCGDLPAAVDTALAAVLREGLTNLLRHSKAEQCVLRAVRHGGAVRLTVANDGAGRAARAPKAGADGGLAALDSRIRSLGGSLTWTGDDGWFRLRATVPLQESAPERDRGVRAKSRVADEAGQPARARRRRPGHPDLVPRAASAITVAVLVGYFLACSVIALSYRPPAPVAAGMGLCLLAGLAVQLLQSFHWRFARTARWSGTLRYGVLGLQALLQFLPYRFFGPTWFGLPGLLAGGALLALPAVVAWPVLLAVTACSDATLYAVGSSTTDIVYQSAYIVICGLVVFGLSRMAQLATELHWSRAEIARLAVTTERLRFARDLHDLLGFSLSAITLKCELIRRLARDRPERAQAELTEVLRIARQALADVRTVAGGLRRMSLSAEAENATAMLAGVGITATVRLDCGELPGDVDTVLATMLREGLTNMLRHSKAEQCRITAERTAGAVRLTLVNDGADGLRAEETAPAADGGSGIGNLTSRVQAVNGRLTAGPRPGGWFELTAEVALAAA
ncbi:sensor histidine kinase [Streptomyces sp. NPDC018019]|uniref:sensor histidine kinase n=1 Tax=Streptomyces sp. NPDC018019 TaxID=3365030 RepID=UPI00378BC4E6